MAGPYWQDQFNPVRGCSEASPGCAHCYARTMHERFRSEPFSDVRTLPEVLSKQLRRRKPTTYFVCNMSDLFHSDVPDEFIAAVFGVMAASPQHTFLVLTKRAARMRALLTSIGEERFPRGRLQVSLGAYDWDPGDKFDGQFEDMLDSDEHGRYWPLPNVWLGVTTEDQEQAEKRIPHLLAAPAAHRWVSAEPLLGAIDFSDIGDALFDRKAAIRAAMNGPSAMNYEQADAVIADVGLDAVIVGGESGPKARMCEAAWLRAIVRQCREAGTPCFVKQVGSKPAGYGRAWAHRSGADPSEWPSDLRVRELAWEV